jgi:glutamate--cysteine ligase catalytic subunit
MGLLSEGHPLTWAEIKAVLEQLRTYGSDQLVRVYDRSKHRQGDEFSWGDEVLSDS